MTRTRSWRSKTQLRSFGADEIIISTHSPAHSNRLERDIVKRARERFALPITHVVIDSEVHVQG